MVSTSRGSIFTRKDGRYFVYLPKSLVEDTAFPFSMKSSVKVKISFDTKGKKLIIEKYKK
ncbi:hypothetical protein A3K80_02010 [Candidatus Bathyarchaeota archaeon RBG_13_38_9]|nr:hypothetical protein [Candidatus Bathyarchaeota archaeon]OGD54959.1 MAG: hypothetical protein A3K80_02010 [Candidatus Bathyarchaeota archaeon RBG_13_38_9]